jgi:putative ABC transport system permease protein
MPVGVKYFEYIRLAFDALLVNKIRSLLTTIGILLGVIAIIVIFTAIQSINSYVEGEFSAIGSSTLYLSKFPWIQTGDYWKYRNRPSVTIDEYKILKEKIEYARWISPQVEAMRTVEYRNKSLEQVYTIGCNEQYVETNNSITEMGRFFTESEVYRGRQVCIIGQSVWEELFGDIYPIGKRIKINGYPVKIIGILEKKGNMFGFNMDNQVIVPFTTFKGISFHRRSIDIVFRAENPVFMDELESEIRGEMRRIRKLAPREEDDFSINQQSMLTDFYKKITGTSYLIVFIVGAISLLVGGIGIMNIMLVSVTERTKEIGIRKSSGANKFNIMMQFLSESVVISSIGGILGILIGVGVGQYLLHFIKLDASVSLPTVLIGYGFSAFVGVVSGLYPAYKAAGLNPIDALRYE